MKILAFDPGKTNFAWALIRDGRCRRHGFVQTATNLSFDHIHDEIGCFTREVAALVRKHKPDFIAAERMQHRPKMGAGAVVEYINVMIGAMLVTARPLKTMMVPPGVWKAWAKRQFSWPKGAPFTLATQKLQIKAPPGTTRKRKGKMVPVKKVTREIRGAFAGQPGHDGNAADGQTITPHEADAIGIGCYCWYRITRINILDQVLR